MTEAKNKTMHEAFIEAYAQMPDPQKNADNPAFKRNGKPMRYADLEAFLDVAKPILVACGFALIQAPINEEARVGVHTWLLYKTGETMDFGRFTVELSKPDPQGAGAALTYCRRYAVAAIFGLAQEDDDANRTSATPAQSKPPAARSGGNTASDKQVSMIFALGRKLGWSEDETIATVRKSTGKDHPGDLEGGRGGEASRFIDALNTRVKAQDAHEDDTQGEDEGSPQGMDEPYEEPPAWAEEIPF